MDDSFYDILAGHYDDLQLNGDSASWGPYIFGLIKDFCSIKDPELTHIRIDSYKLALVHAILSKTGQNIIAATTDTNDFYSNNCSSY